MQKKINLYYEGQYLSEETVQKACELLNDFDGIDSAKLSQLLNVAGEMEGTKKMTSEDVYRTYLLAQNIKANIEKPSVRTSVPKDVEVLRAQIYKAQILFEQMLDLTREVIAEQRDMYTRLDELNDFGIIFDKEVQKNAVKHMNNHKEFVKEMKPTLDGFKSTYTQTRTAFDTLQKNMVKLSTLYKKHDVQRSLVDDLANEVTSMDLDEVLPGVGVIDSVEKYRELYQELKDGMADITEYYNDTQYDYRDSMQLYKTRDDIVRETSAIAKREGLQQ